VECHRRPTNREHARARGGVFTPEELREAAGAICAARLISDVDGISSSDRDDRADYPSYRSIPFFEPEKVRAIIRGLGRGCGEARRFGLIG
jgi:hypothetical protein